MNERIKKLWYVYTHTYTMKYYSAIKNMELLPFTTWMNTEGFMLGGMSDRQRNTNII